MQPVTDFSYLSRMTNQLLPVSLVEVNGTTPWRGDLLLHCAGISLTQLSTLPT